MEQLDLRGLKEKQGPKEFKEFKDQQVQRDLKERLVLKESKVFKGQLVPQVLKERLGLKEFKVYKDQLVQLVLKVRLELKVPQAKLQPYQLERYLVEKVPLQLLLVLRQIMF